MKALKVFFVNHYEREKGESLIKISIYHLALFYLSIAATMLAVGVGLRIICEEVTGMNSIYFIYPFYFLTNVGATVCMDITKNLFRTVLQQEIDFFNENKSGTLLSRITNDVFIVRHIMGFSVGQASVYIVLLLGVY